MKRNNCYVLERLDGVPYLLPFGQAQADQKRGMMLNDTGEFIWNLLEREQDKEEIFAACAAHYRASSEELPQLKKDVESFLGQMTVWGVLASSTDFPTSTSTHVRYLSIAGFNLCLYGPDEAFSEEFNNFKINRNDPPEMIHQTISVSFRDSLNHLNGQVLLRSEELVVIENENRYILLFPCARQIYEAQLSRDGSRATFYCQGPCTDLFREDLFHAIRLVFLFLLDQNHMTVIHSASLLYRGKAWLFSGPSGTGKSTHTGLWNRLFRTPLINGDLNLLAVEAKKPVIHGLPWCGTSGISDTNTHPLGGIILLKQAADDYVEELSGHQKLLLIQQRLITPSWTADRLETNLRLVEQLIPHILVCRLHCTVRDNAADVMRERIDRFISETS